MIEITIPDAEYFDDESGKFTKVKGATIQLEHSLISVSKWESKYCKPFIVQSNDPKLQHSGEEMIDYIRCMTITKHVDPAVYYQIPQNEMDRVTKYIESPATAEVFTEYNRKNQPAKKEKITSDLIYFWMIHFGIPFECERWHLNRLLALIRLCQIENDQGSKSNKMNRRETYDYQRQINEMNKARFHTKG